MNTNIGMIIIGRNEGEQLRRCFQSIAGKFVRTVYVDSGSTDQSVEIARSMGVDVVNLDMTRPFTAARARNEGFARLMKHCPDLEFVHFLDGDVEMIDGWLESAIQVMKDTPKAAVLSGLRIEKRPEASVFIRLCNIEWNKADGYPACEGDAIMRIAAFKKIGGFNESLIAGEEPELCLRYWQNGFVCLRNRVPMTLHDVGLTHFSQWWRRESRTGFSYAEGAAMYGRIHYLRQSMGIWFWGLGVPLVALALAWPTYGLSLLGGLLLYGVLFYRALRGIRPRAASTWLAAEYAFFNVLSKFPMLAGMLRYWFGRFTGKQGKLIEYRKATAAGSANSQTSATGASIMSTSSNNVVRVGIIGCGHVTERHHLPTLAGIDIAKITAIADLDAARRNRLGDQYQVAARYKDHHELLADPNIDAVAVLVPPQFHVPVALEALEAGKHIFIEKPLADSLDGTEKLVARAQQLNTKSTIGFMLRSHRLVRQARQIILSGGIGKIEMIRTVWTGGPAHRLTLPGWLNERKAGGGVLIESGVHHYDMWRYLLDDEVAEVSAYSRNEPTQDAVAVVSGRMVSGILATSVFSMGTADNHEIEVYGDGGRLRVSAYRVDGLEVYRLRDHAGGIKNRVKRLVKQAREFPKAYQLSRSGGVFNEAYVNEWRSFLDAIRQNRPPVAALEDGRRSLVIAVAAAQSADLNRPVALKSDYADPRRNGQQVPPAAEPRLLAGAGA